MAAFALRSRDCFVGLGGTISFHRAVSSLTRSLIRSGVGGMACPSTSRSLVATSQSSDNLRLRNGGNRSLTGLS